MSLDVKAIAERARAALASQVNGLKVNAEHFFKVLPTTWPSEVMLSAAQGWEQSARDVLALLEALSEARSDAGDKLNQAIKNAALCKAARDRVKELEADLAKRVELSNEIARQLKTDTDEYDAHIERLEFVIERAKFFEAAIYDRLAHGDDVHRAWLKTELDFMLAPIRRGIAALDPQDGKDTP